MEKSAVLFLPDGENTNDKQEFRDETWNYFFIRCFFLFFVCFFPFAGWGVPDNSA
jgi:hypothetical protein